MSFNNYNSGGTLSANQIKLGLIGDTISTTTVFNGAFDELKMFTTQLTNDEMYQLYLDKKIVSYITFTNARNILVLHYVILVQVRLM